MNKDVAILLQFHNYIKWKLIELINVDVNTLTMSSKMFHLLIQYFVTETQIL